jgi:SRSO17 transposase
MTDLAEFERYMRQLCEKLGHADRRAGFVEYSRGLMLPLERIWRDNQDESGASIKMRRGGRVRR